MGKVGKKFVLLLDVDRVLAAPELRAAAALAAPGRRATAPRRRWQGAGEGRHPGRGMGGDWKRRNDGQEIIVGNLVKQFL